ncbi:hypothetical protein C4D60_Mb06t15730 [Musa balbisiana]|uniref:Uncharacterized protein n=1 Tax=Musa balbisiana TaxID=52838 RepID=A0A4S8IND8_MUSBA|nr:hypothetical protein C4D60_Mb06t15730 [Musa balbisiana]
MLQALTVRKNMAGTPSSLATVGREGHDPDPIGYHARQGRPSSVTIFISVLEVEQEFLVRAHGPRLQRLQQIQQARRGSAALVFESVGDRAEAESGTSVQPRIGDGVASEQAEVVVGVEEGDVKAGQREQLGQLQHGVDMALQREREHQHVIRHAPHFSAPSGWRGSNNASFHLLA